MIQFFQKLKAKKGFTLVELIVVIAIIGVLAAILVPTMLGYVTNSRVTSCDSTAASISKEIDSFLTTCDTNGYGMKKGGTFTTGTIDVANGDWTVKLTNVAGFTSVTGGVQWTANASTAVNSTNKKSDANNSGETLMAIQLAGLFPDVKNAHSVFALAGGKCIAIVYSTDPIPAVLDASATGLQTAYDISNTGDQTNASQVQKTDFAWDGNTAGVAATGEIVGSSPKLTVSVA